MNIMEFNNVRQQTGEMVKTCTLEDWIRADFTPTSVRECKYNVTYEKIRDFMQFKRQLAAAEAFGEDPTPDQKQAKEKMDTLLDKAKDGRCYVVGAKLDQSVNVRKSNMDYRELIPIDIDDTLVGFDEIRERCEAMGFNYILHTTFKHTEAYPRYRVLIPTDGKIYTERQYLELIESVLKDHFPEVQADNMGKRWAQKMYYPLIPKNGRDHYKMAYRSDRHNYHVDEMPKTEEDMVFFEELDGEKHTARTRTGDRSVQRLPDPAQKSGWFGAVCGVYNVVTGFQHIPELKKRYVHAYDNRFGYDKTATGSKKGNPGVVVDDGTKCPDAPWSWAISYHENDPMNKGTDGKQHWKNIYDIWCLSCFDGDEQRFNDWLAAGNDPKVRAEYDRRGREWAEKNRMDRQNPGTNNLEYTPQNIATPAPNDPISTVITKDTTIFVARDRKSFHHKVFNADRKAKIRTGIDILDERLGGGLRKGITVIGAEPSCGKSTFCLQIADFIARTRPVLYVSLEMDAENLYTKSISRITREQNPDNPKKWLSFDDIEENAQGFSAEQMEVYANAENAYFGLYEVVIDQATFIEEVQDQRTGTISARNVAYTVQRIKELTGFAPVVFIDYLQLLNLQDVSELGRDMRLMIDDTVLYLKHQIASAYDIPVILISSLNREAYKDTRDKEGKPTKKPGLSMTALKESGGVEFTAENIILMSHFEPEGDNLDDEKILFEIHKNRYGKKSIYVGNLADLDHFYPESGSFGLLGGFLLSFDKEHSHFREIGV